MNNSTFVRVLRKVERIFVIMLFLGIGALLIIYFGKLILGYLLALFTFFVWHWYQNIGKGDIEIDNE